MEALRGFAAPHGITYPLLSDEGSRAIRRLGMLDEDVERHHAEFGRPVRDDQRGVAYPGVFLLDRDGVVLKKRFHKNYRIRDTGAGLLEAALGVAGPEGGPAQAVHRDVVRVRLSLDSPAYRPYQQLRLAAVLAIEPGWHVYAAPVPESYTPLSLEVVPAEGIEVGEVTWPAPHPFRIDGLEEEFRVHDGTIRGTVPLTFALAATTGVQVLRATVRYQACSDTECLPPDEVRFELRVPEGPPVDQPAGP